MAGFYDLDDNAVIADMNVQIREMVGFWHTAAITTINGLSFVGTKMAEKYALVALGGNMIWAAASLMPQTRVGVIVARVLNFGGAAVGAAPGVASAKGSYTDAVDVAVSNVKANIVASLDRALNAAREQSALNQITHALLPKVKANGWNKKNTQEARRRLIWKYIFKDSIPYNSIADIRSKIEKVVTDLLKITIEATPRGMTTARKKHRSMPTASHPRRCRL